MPVRVDWLAIKFFVLSGLFCALNTVSTPVCHIIKQLSTRFSRPVDFLHSYNYRHNSFCQTTVIHAAYESGNEIFFYRLLQPGQSLPCQPFVGISVHYHLLPYDVYNSRLKHLISNAISFSQSALFNVHVSEANSVTLIRLASFWKCQRCMNKLLIFPEWPFSLCLCQSHLLLHNNSTNYVDKFFNFWLIN